MVTTSSEVENTSKPNKDSESFSRSIKIRLYPNKSQINICENSFKIDRFVFNRALALKKSRWENHRENLSWIEISKMFTLMKKSVDLKISEYDWAGEIGQKKFVQNKKQSV